MNRRGSIMFSVIVAVLIFLYGILFIGFLSDEVVRSQNSENLDCDNSDISDGTKLTCLVTEGVIPYFIIALISVAGGLITSKLTL